jgi:outer membrane autotransporter protein
VGAALGYGEGDMRVDDRASTADTESVTASLYGGRTAPSAAGRWHLLLGGAYSHHSIDSERRVRFNGFDETLIADYRARTTQVFGEVGHAWTLNDALTLTPFAGLAWSEQRTDGFTEEGGAAALTADEAHTAVTTTTLGVRGRAGFD